MKRKYRLADSTNRKDVDLTKYEEQIMEAIHKERPDVKVTVNQDSYTLDRELKRGEAIRIGRALAKTELGKFCANRYVLFFGQTVEEGEENHGGNGKKSNPKGKNNTSKKGRK